MYFIKICKFSILSDPAKIYFTDGTVTVFGNNYLGYILKFRLILFIVPLPVKEQMLTFLAVIGFEEQVNESLEAQQTEMSAEAVALKEQIKQRIDAMTEEEKAAFETTLMESFPSQQVLIDGVEYTFFVIEIEVRRGDEVRIERYGFRHEGEEWIFTKLFIEE